jgi:hypothetical protein
MNTIQNRTNNYQSDMLAIFEQKLIIVRKR